jgi:hypothetical protein
MKPGKAILKNLSRPSKLRHLTGLSMEEAENIQSESFKYGLIQK